MGVGRYQRTTPETHRLPFTEIHLHGMSDLCDVFQISECNRVFPKHSAHFSCLLQPPPFIFCSLHHFSLKTHLLRYSTITFSQSLMLYNFHFCIFKFVLISLPFIITSIFYVFLLPCL
jgi:hypothetical protein